MRRVVVWFSCGAASAVAAQMARRMYGSRVSVVYCDTMASEHPDNERFLRDVEKWIDAPVVRIKSDKYGNVDEVFERTRYMAGIGGARCTAEMKKLPRIDYQRTDDTHIFGLTSDEPGRVARMKENHPELAFDWILYDAGVSKAMCLDEIKAAGIELPAMYRLGYGHNNCIGCVKATSPKYWDQIRRDFPETFKRRAAQSRALGVRLARLHGERVFIDQIPLATDEICFDDMSCGPDCGSKP